MVDLEILDVKITLVYWRYKAMNFSLHCSIKYFKNNKCSPSILNLFFLLVRLFRRDFQRNVQHSIHTGDIAKRNSNIHFILGNTGHAWREWTVKDFQCTLIMGWCKNVACVCVYVCVCVGGGGEGGRFLRPALPLSLCLRTSVTSRLILSRLFTTTSLSPLRSTMQPACSLLESVQL